jgi:hypothetical protein
LWRVNDGVKLLVFLFDLDHRRPEPSALANSVAGERPWSPCAHRGRIAPLGGSQPRHKPPGCWQLSPQPFNLSSAASPGSRTTVCKHRLFGDRCGSRVVRSRASFPSAAFFQRIGMSSQLAGSARSAAEASPASTSGAGLASWILAAAAGARDSPRAGRFRYLRDALLALRAFHHRADGVRVLCASSCRDRKHRSRPGARLVRSWPGSSRGPWPEHNLPPCRWIDRTRFFFFSSMA